MSTPEYQQWQLDPTPDNMAKIMESLDPLLNSEIQRYQGPKPLLKTKAKELTVAAVKSYKPAAGVKLQSWVVTNLQPLTRYSHKLRPIHASEARIRQAAELNRLRQELSDDLGREPNEDELADHAGLSATKIRRIRASVPAVVPESAFEVSDDDDRGGLPPVSEASQIRTIEAMVYDALSPRDKQIYDLKTGKTGQVMSNAAIAKYLGVTPALVSQRSKAIAEHIKTVYSRKRI